MSKKYALFPAFIALGMVALCAFYGYKNWHKVVPLQQRIHAILSGEKALSLSVIHNGKTVYEVDLPTSDLIDRSGMKRLNFRYLSNEEWISLKAILRESQFYLNGLKVEDVRLQLRDKAAAIVLPERKVYLLSPPHSAMFAKAMSYEKSNRRDIFSCVSEASFCRSVRIVDFGGMTEIKEAVLAQDFFFGEYAYPRGRWAVDRVQLKVFSERSQAVTIRYLMDIPFEAQEAVVLEPKGAKITVKNSEETRDISLGVPMRAFTMQVDAVLEQGDNIITVLMMKMMKKTRHVRLNMSGVMKKVEISSRGSE